MAQKLESGPKAREDRLLAGIRETLTVAKDHAALKLPVRQASGKALTWISQTNFDAEANTPEGKQAIKKINDLRSVLSSVAGGYTDAGLTSLAKKARGDSRHLAKRFGLDTGQPSDAAIDMAVSAIANIADRPPGRLGGR